MTPLENAVTVLRCFSLDARELTVTEAAQRLGLPKSNVSRLLRAMREVGLLDAGVEGRGYRPGVMLVGFGQIAQSGHSLGARANAAARRLSEVTGHSGFASARIGREMVGLVHHVGTNTLQVGMTLGQRFPIDASATGRALLAGWSRERVTELLQGEVSRIRPHSPQTMDELFERLARVRAQGWSESREEAGKGVGALAVAVREPRTGEELSVCITFPVATVDAAEHAQLVALLLQARSEIEKP
ncbi:MAG: IclR family transcriptional regulator [Burkholderiales bacterium]|nr:IclR family transcriptional regulator [Burkholderiales bacterium]MDE2453957.1 IclR family transcriptional regulator [Burkholderiales bacterium]